MADSSFWHFTFNRATQISTNRTELRRTESLHRNCGPALSPDARQVLADANLSNFELLAHVIGPEARDFGSTAFLRNK
jgi:hypothetical protein